MSVERSYARLGVFIAIALVVILGTAVLFIQRARTRDAQIDRMATELDGLIGKEGTLAKFTEETQAALTAADLSSTTKAAREAASESRIAADELRRSLPAIRDTLEQMRELARLLEEQPESVVYGPRPTGAKHP